MSEIVCEWLGLDREMVGAHADAYRGMAYARLDRESPPKNLGEAARSRDHAISAHYLAAACGYVSAASPADAGPWFHDAAEWSKRQADERRRGEGVADPHRRGWQLRAVLLDACQPRPTMGEELSGLVSTERPAAPGEIHVLLLAVMRHLANEQTRSAWMYSALERLSREAQEKRIHPVGVLRIPLGFVDRLSRLLREGVTEIPEPLLIEWAREFGARLAERVGIAQSNASQWGMLHTRLLPIEPEALLALEVWSEVAAASRPSRMVQELLSNTPPVMRAYAESARVILSSLNRDLGEAH